MRVAISKDSIYHEVRLPFIAALLCYFGWHRWRYFRMSELFEEQERRYGEASIHRRCQRCKWMEVSYDA